MLGVILKFGRVRVCAAIVVDDEPRTGRSTRCPARAIGSDRRRLTVGG